MFVLPSGLSVSHVKCLISINSYLPSHLHTHHRENDYTTGVTSSAWPSRQYWQTLARELGIPDDLVVNSQVNGATEADILRNYLKLEVYFGSLNVRQEVETPKYSVRKTVFVASRRDKDLKRCAGRERLRRPGWLAQPVPGHRHHPLLRGARARLRNRR